MPDRGHESEISGQNEGKVNTVRYDAMNAMLLNEFLKEHRKNARSNKQAALRNQPLRFTVWRLYCEEKKP